MVTSARRATPEDAGVLVDLMREFHAESNYALDQDRAKAAFMVLLSRPELGGVWVASCEGVVAGYVVLTLRYSMDHGASVGHVEDLYVKTRFRRRGIGSTLLSALFDECRHLRCGEVHVEVSGHDGPAMRLYRTLGFNGYQDDRMFMHAAIGAPVA
jgi:ribosomal protein S18 acetylase RimI-like enzyme